MTAPKYRVAYEYSGLGLGIVRDDGEGSPLNVRVSTWADGFGTWFVTFRTTGNTAYDRHIARMAVKHQAVLHDGASEDWTPSVQLKARPTVSDPTVTYSER